MISHEKIQTKEVPANSSSLEGTQELAVGSEGGLNGTLKSNKTRKEEDSLSLGSEFASSFTKGIGSTSDLAHLSKLPRYVAKYAFAGEKEKDLPLKPGTIVYVEKKRKNDWWVCIADGKRGLVPRTYLTELKDPQSNVNESSQFSKQILIEESKEDITQ